MKTMFKILLSICFLSSIAFASAYNDYREVQSREILHKKYVDCRKYAESYLTAIRLTTGTTYCYELGAKKCKEVETEYKSIIEKCEVNYGKYK